MTALVPVAGLVHSRPEFLYFWFYFVIVNSVWIVIPTIMIVNAARAIHEAVDFQQRCAPRLLVCVAVCTPCNEPVQRNHPAAEMLHGGLCRAARTRKVS